MMHTTETTPPAVIKVNHVSKEFALRKDNSLKERIIAARQGRSLRSEFHALKDISLSIQAGTTVGLVGHNGSGKSTLLKIIGGILDPTSGSVARRGRVAALLELGAGFHPDLSGRDNVYLNAALLGLSTAETDAVFQSIVDFAEIPQFIDTQVKFYSSGMYVRLAFAVAVHTDPDILLVDEVLAVGDEVFQRKCMDKIHEFQAEGRTIVLVSHSAAQVEELCDRVVVLHRGEPVYDGEPAEGIKLLRSGYERDRQESMRLEQDSASTPRITLLRVDSEQAIEEITVEKDKPFDIVFEYRLPHAVTTDLRLGIGLDTHMGQTLRGASSMDFGLSLPTDAGTHRVKFEVGFNPLSVGKFSIRGVLETGDGELLDHLTPASYFSVVLPDGEQTPDNAVTSARVVS